MRKKTKWEPKTKPTDSTTLQLCKTENFENCRRGCMYFKNGDCAVDKVNIEE